MLRVKEEGELREANHRQAEAARQQQRIDKQSDDLKETKETTAQIETKWQAASKLSDAYKLNDALSNLQKECDTVMKSKLALRKTFVDEQKTKDEEFVKELREQADNIGKLPISLELSSLVVDRLTSETVLEKANLFTKQYDETQAVELSDIERAFMLERNEYLESNKKELDEIAERRRQLEKYLSMRLSSRMYR